MYLLTVAALLAVLLFCGKRANAQAGGTSATVTILPADPLLRPVPETGFGVSYNHQGELESTGLSKSDHRSLHRKAEPDRSDYADCVQARNPAGQSFVNHRLALHRTEASKDERYASAHQEIIVALE